MCSVLLLKAGSPLRTGIDECAWRSRGHFAEILAQTGKHAFEANRRKSASYDESTPQTALMRGATFKSDEFSVQDAKALPLRNNASVV